MSCQNPNLVALDATPDEHVDKLITHEDRHRG
jgi:hypothetical protein